MFQTIYRNFSAEFKYFLSESKSDNVNYNLNVVKNNVCFCKICVVKFILLSSYWHVHARTRVDTSI